MSDLELHPIPKIQGFNCFACGTENSQGIGMVFAQAGDKVVSDVVLPTHLVGWEKIAHGGIVTILLDEISAWTILYFKRAFCVTREIKVRFHKPVPVGEPLRVSGRLCDDQPMRFSALVDAEVRSEDGVLLASARADFALLRDEQLALLPEKVRVSMSDFLRSLEEWAPDGE